MTDKRNQTIAVTGATGFIGGHCVLDLLRNGYRVRAILRNESQREAVINAVSDASTDGTLEFGYAELTEPAGWEKALSGCDAVFHVASPLPSGPDFDADELIKIATSGTLNVFEGALKAGINRVILTSSLGAVCGSALHENCSAYSEDDWTDINDPKASAYNLSKTMAEIAARDFAKKHSAFDMISINPGVTIGPILNGRMNVSNKIINDLAKGQMSILPPVTYEFVDVRDVASLHRLAFEQANDQSRLMCSSEFLSFEDLSKLIASSSDGETKFPEPMLFDPTSGPVPESISGYEGDFGVLRPVDWKITQEKLNWTPRSIKESIADSLVSFERFGL